MNDLARNAAPVKSPAVFFPAYTGDAGNRFVT